MRIFISVQRVLNPSQQLLLDAVQMQLKYLSFTPMRTEENFGDKFSDPFPRIRQTILSCYGAIVIAFERLQCSSCIEYPGDGNTFTFYNHRSSTIWNHIEGAMAYQAGLPVLVLQEKGLRQVGITDMQLKSIKVAEFHIDECAEELPKVIKEAINEWAQSIMSR